MIPRSVNKVVKDPKHFVSVHEAFEYCKVLYEKQIALLEDAVRQGKSLVVFYPYIAIEVVDQGATSYYGNTITKPDLLKAIYLTQISKILSNSSGVKIWVGESFYPISLALVCEDLITEENMCNVMPCIERIRTGMDKIEKGTHIKRIGFFHAERVDYCLNRLHHYCGTSNKYFQSNVIFTNYKMYIDFFIEDGKKLVDQGVFSSLIGPDIEYSKDVNIQKKHNLPQMPAYHLVKQNGKGITIINVGVGPSNSKTITDHLSVLSCDSWLMLGHCAGLDPLQRLGDYVLAQNYSRYDNVLDKYISNKIPIPSCARIINSLKLNAEKNKVNGEKLHTGTIITTADRNWELDCDMVGEFVSSKAIAIDMESATISANAFRFSIPSASFLCISDMPLHGLIKLRGMAKKFYQTKVRHHFNIGLSAIQDLL
ncbi:MAG: AMP nucleosidase [Alphaproteobacteria bacterium]|nr:MAG: AMP nucleosidase [Alphaproteobacteria bacterium]